ncbi:hypothetical protein [Kribbella sp. VKM Ac-2566]|uniref:hypothetical protein n=1 Tax=Kribbella sp. VKM Ac-2566 TaxID=2512218 RepID=UPI0014170E84|nr:hypothetical protein [Kribbella sp. VKM Ac-2566]
MAEWRETLDRFLAADPRDVGCDEVMAAFCICTPNCRRPVSIRPSSTPGSPAT